MKLIINESVIISCRAQSWPPPSTKWVLERNQKFKEFKGVIQHTDNQVFSQINILRMSSQFEGTYTFIAENKFGKRTRKVQVDLLPPPGKRLYACHTINNINPRSLKEWEGGGSNGYKPWSPW